MIARLGAEADGAPDGHVPPSLYDARAALHRLSADVVDAAGRYLVGLLLLWPVVGGLILAGAPVANRYGGAGVPLVVFLLGACMTWRLVSRNRLSLLSPVPLGLAFVALCYGFGPLLHVFQPDSTYVTANNRLPIDDAGVFRVQLLNLAGVTCLTAGLVAAGAAGVRLSRESGGGRPDDARTQDGFAPGTGHEELRDRFLLRAWVGMTAVAVVIRALGWGWGMTPASSLPGFLQVVDSIGVVAVLVGAIAAARKGGTYWLLPLVPLAIEMINGLLVLEKAKVLAPIVFAFLGVYLGGMSKRLIVLGVAASLGLFALLYPLINEGRRLVWNGREPITSLEFYVEKLPERAAQASDVDLWHGWARFNFTPVQHRLMQEYDAGRPGRTYRDLPWFFVPRFLAPSKPILNNGRRLNDLLFGHQRSAMSATNFGEAYWNGGWLLVPITGLVAGVVVFVTAAICLWLFSRPSLAAWAVGFMGIRTSQMLQNFFTSGLLGTTIILYCLALLLAALFWVRRAVLPASGKLVPGGWR
jgi:hypothetical protein